MPVFDIDAKTITRPGADGADGGKAQKMLRIDFSGEFKKYDVMEELGLDPLDLGRLDTLRPKLKDMLITEDKVDSNFVQQLNDKQLFDKLIEERIEVKSTQTD